MKKEPLKELSIDEIQQVIPLSGRVLIKLIIQGLDLSGLVRIFTNKDISQDTKRLVLYSNYPMLTERQKDMVWEAYTADKKIYKERAK